MGRNQLVFRKGESPFRFSPFFLLGTYFRGHRGVKSFSSSFPRLFSLTERVVDLLCPPLCIVCGSFPEWAEDLPESDPSAPERLLLCERCRRTIVEEDHLQCRRCAGPLAYSCSDSIGCGNCKKEKFCFDSTVALGEYQIPLSHQILSMKRETSGVSAETFAALLWRERKTRLVAAGVDLVIPVPMHPLRYLLRGVNSAEQIARVLAARLGVACKTNIVRRFRWTIRQATLSGNLRRTNILGAFKVVPRRRNEIEGKTVLLVDDVMTTGSTCNEVSRVLRQEGAASVHVAVLARAMVHLGIPVLQRTGRTAERKSPAE